MEAGWYQPASLLYLSRYRFHRLLSAAIGESPGAFRRTMAVLALRELGVDDIGLGDPIEWERDQGNQ